MIIGSCGGVRDDLLLVIELVVVVFFKALVFGIIGEAGIDRQ